MIQVVIQKWQCNRCHHEWIPRVTHEPVRCPDCKSPYWNKTRKHSLAAQAKRRIKQKGSRG